MVSKGGAPGKGKPMGDQVKEEAEMAVEELRLFISLYEGVELAPGSRAARQVEAARRAVAAYDEVERALDGNAA
jgi:hypothetical protein